jgi:type I restriction enzyme M protein
MRKSLGNKRNELGPEQIDEVTRLYGGFEENERVRIVPNEFFGHQRITVERPLRRRYEITEGTLAAIQASPGWMMLSEPERLALIGRLSLVGRLSTTDRGEADRRLRPIPKAIEKAVWESIAVRDPDAPASTNGKGHLEPDPALRDNENVPLPGPVEAFDVDPTARLTSPRYRQAVEGYMAAEVLPYVPDAWVEHAKTNVGYEIPLTRLFYKHVTPRPLEEIDGEIRALEDEIQRLLRDVAE